MTQESPQGPFDRILAPAAERTASDRAIIYVAGTIFGLAVLLLVLILPPISILSRGDNDADAALGGGPAESDRYTSTVRSGIPKLPAGLVAASPFFDLSAPAGQTGASGLTVPLKEKQSDARSLAMYTYSDGRWRRLSDVTLVSGGAAARGDVRELPGNVAVLRRDQSSLQVAGALPAGATLDPRADPVITMLNPLVFIPVDNGDILGTPPAVPPASYKVVPGIVAPNAEVVDAILRGGDTRQRHATAIAAAVTTGNFAGINIDYRNVNPSLREQYTQFVQALSDALHADGRTLTLTLPMPSVQAGQVDTGAYDWAALGPLADTVVLAGELDQELYFQNTEAALAYVVEQVDRTKVLLTISAQSIERGGDGLRTMALDTAMATASVVGVKTEGEITAGSAVDLVGQNLAESEGASGIAWDETARAVTFSYPGRGGKRTLWIANQFSAGFRLELAQRFNLGGVFISDVSLENGGGDVWSPVREFLDSGTLTLIKPNGELFAPTWSANEGALSATTGGEVTWTAPAEAGTYEITLVVSDGAVRVGQRIAVEVTAAPEPE